MTNPKVLIIGAGMGGLTLAIGLAQAGFPVEVHEQTAVLGELGAGLTIRPSAMQVFDAIGVWDQVREITSSGGGAFVHYQTLELLQGEANPDWDRRPTSPDQGGHAHRAAVHAILVARLRALAPNALVLGHRLTACTQDDDGVRVSFANGDTTTGDLLVACDGLRSSTYAAVFGADNPARFTGVMAIRCMIPRTASLEPFLGGGRMVKYVAPGRGLNRYGVSGGTLVNCVALAETDPWREEGWTHPCSRAEFRELYHDFHPDVLGLIDHAPDESIFKWALYDREPLDTWTRDRAVLLGDAAHPMLPFLGQGATAAIEDAMVLIRSLQAHRDHRDAFAAYQSDRMALTRERMLAARAQGRALNQPDPYAYTRLRPNTNRLEAYDPLLAAIDDLGGVS